MSDKTPIVFSLPSVMSGENDASGICTAQLLLTLHRLHEELLEMGNRHEDQENDHQDIHRSFVFEISYLTPPSVVKSKLLTYDRLTHLLPLLQLHAHQSLRFGKGNLEFDLETIERKLKGNLLIGKQNLRLHLRHYQYRGDIRGSGRVTGLRRRIPQEALPLSILNQVMEDFDTQEKVVNFLGKLEVCMTFLADVGGDLVRDMEMGQMPLRNYMVHTLQTSTDEWEKISTKTIDDHVRLCHLQSLFMQLEESMNGSPLDDVLHIYQEPLGLAQIRSLEALKDLEGSGKYLSSLLPMLRDFLVEQLTKDQWSPNASLKEYLSYLIADDKVADWFDENFPDNLSLKHGYFGYRWFIDTVG